jgi:putative ABC transport system substrate-binding protein
MNGEPVQEGERRTRVLGRVSRRAFLAGTVGLTGSGAGVTLVGGCQVTFPWSKPPVKAVRLGFLGPSPDDPSSPLWQKLSQHGWTRGDNLLVEYRAGVVETYQAQAADLVSLGVALIITQAEGPTHAAKEATNSIPIVMLAVSDAVGGGLVTNLARPGGNVTGLSVLGPEIRAKDLDLLRELTPGLSKVAVLWGPAILDALREYTRISETAQASNIEILSAEAGTPTQVAFALDHIKNRYVEGLIVLGLASYLIPPAFRNILNFAATQKIPAIYSGRSWVTSGGLMSYSYQVNAYYEHGAVVVDKILRGANPGDIPVEQPTVFDLVVNTRTAESLGLVIPPSVSALVTEWIQ